MSEAHFTRASVCSTGHRIRISIFEKTTRPPTGENSNADSAPTRFIPTFLRMTEYYQPSGKASPGRLGLGIVRLTRAAAPQKWDGTEPVPPGISEGALTRHF
jgi:hypothetical protein